MERERARTCIRQLSQQPLTLTPPPHTHPSHSPLTPHTHHSHSPLTPHTHPSHSHSPLTLTTHPHPSHSPLTPHTHHSPHTLTPHTHTHPSHSPLTLTPHTHPSHSPLTPHTHPSHSHSPLTLTTHPHTSHSLLTLTTHTHPSSLPLHQAQCQQHIPTQVHAIQTQLLQRRTQRFQGNRSSKYVRGCQLQICLICGQGNLKEDNKNENDAIILNTHIITSFRVCQSQHATSTCMIHTTCNYYYMYMHTHVPPP